MCCHSLDVIHRLFVKEFIEKDGENQTNQEQLFQIKVKNFKLIKSNHDHNQFHSNRIIHTHLPLNWSTRMNLPYPHHPNSSFPEGWH